MDRELIEKSRAGDREAQEELIKKVQDQVHYHCRKMLNHEEDALDATQDVLIAMLKGLETLREPSAFWSWLNRMTTNICCKKLRDCREIPLPPGAPVQDAYGNFDDQTIPEKVLDNEENRRLIVELVEALPEAQRLCVLCYYYDEMSIRDIAEAMETSENTVKSRLYYARKAIKEGVDRYTAEGIKLYAFFPLPFLRYFLQKEAAESLLTPIAAEALRQAVLAGVAGAAGAAAQGGAAVLAGAAAKTLGGAAVRKGLLALAGLVAAGSVGGALLSARRTLPESSQELLPAPPAVVITAPHPAPKDIPPPHAGEAEEIQILPPPVEETPRFQPAEEGVPQPLAEFSGPQMVVVDLEPYVPPQEGGEEPVQPPSSQPGKGTNRVPTRNPQASRDEDRDSDGDDSSSGPPPVDPVVPPSVDSNLKNPVDPPPVDPPPVDPPPVDPPPVDPPPVDPVGPPLIDPSPVNPVDPPVVIPPVTGIVYRPNPEFGAYLGQNAEGVYEFDVELLANWENHPYPFLNGHYYCKEELSDGDRLGCRAGYIYGKVPGSCEVRYYVSKDPNGPYELKGIAHVKVLPEVPLAPDYDWGGYQKTGTDGVYRFRRTLTPGTIVYREPYSGSQLISKVESSNSGVIKAMSTNQLWAVEPGSAEVLYYTRYLEADPWKLTAAVQITVPSPSTPPAPPKEVFQQELTVGYGYASNFHDVWKGELPDGLSFVSSKPSVAYITGSGGGFCTLIPGVTVLSAESPDCRYELTVNVEDALAWKYTLEDKTLPAGTSVEQELVYERLPYMEMNGLYWESEDPRIAHIKALEGEKCLISGIGPGTVTIKAHASFWVLTPDGEKAMKETVSFQVHVEEPVLPPEEEMVVHRKELEKFGYCSGYGGSFVFANKWGDELPENLVYTSSDSAVAVVDSNGHCDALSAGSVELMAFDPDEPKVQYVLALEVQDRFDWSYRFEDGAVDLTNYSDRHGIDSMAISGAVIRSVKFTSSDPDTLEVLFTALNTRSCSLKGLRRGSVELFCTLTFEVDTCVGMRMMEDTISCQITVDYLSFQGETEEVVLTDFGYCSGYGYKDTFRRAFESAGKTMPEEDLYFRSSDSSVADFEKDRNFITKKEGIFLTKKAGRAILLAQPVSGDSGVQYAIIIEVQNRFDWRYTLDNLTLEAGSSAEHGVSAYEVGSDVTVGFASWTSRNAIVLSAERKPGDYLTCVINASQRGVTEVSGFISFNVKNWGTYYENVSFQVTVVEPAPEPPPETPDPPGEPNPPETPDPPGEPTPPETPDPPSEPNPPETPDPPGEPAPPETPDPPSEPNPPETPDPPGEPDPPETPDPPGEPTPPETPDLPSEPNPPETSE